jgi:hypothetical protein
MENKYIKYKNKNIKFRENINQTGGINTIEHQFQLFKLDLPSISSGNKNNIIEMIFRKGFSELEEQYIHHINGQLRTFNKVYIIDVLNIAGSSGVTKRAAERAEKERKMEDKPLEFDPEIINEDKDQFYNNNDDDINNNDDDILKDDVPPHDIKDPPNFLNNIDLYINILLDHIIEHNIFYQKNNKRNLYVLCGKDIKKDNKIITIENLLSARLFSLNEKIKGISGNNYRNEIRDLNGTAYIMSNIQTISADIHEISRNLEGEIIGTRKIYHSADDDFIFWIIAILFISLMNNNLERQSSNINNIKTSDNRFPELLLMTNDKQNLFDKKTIYENNSHSVYYKNMYSELYNKYINRVFLNGIDNHAIRNCIQFMHQYITTDCIRYYGDGCFPQYYESLKNSDERILSVCTTNIINGEIINTMHNRNIQIIDLMNSLNPHHCYPYEKFMTLILYIKKIYYSNIDGTMDHSMNYETINKFLNYQI